MVLTKDARIRRRTLEREALIAAAVHAFFMGNASRTGPLMAKAFVSALPAMLQAIKGAAGPVWMSVHADGRLTRRPHGMAPEAEPEEEVD